MMRNLAISLFLVTFTTGCGDVEGDKDSDCHSHGDHVHCDDEQELIDTVELTLSGPADITATWTEDGADDLVLEANSTYQVDVAFLNAAASPVEDITVEIEDEADAHQVFFHGGDLAYTYGDSDPNGLPLGLTGELTTGPAGSTNLMVTLRHMPEEDGQAVKTDGLVDVLQSEGLAGLPGANDVSVEFNVTVQ